MRIPKKSDIRHSAVSDAFKKHQSALRAFVSRMVSAPADIDDVTQETFLRAFNAEKSKDIDQPKSFLFTIARNIVLSEISKKSNKLTDHIEDLEEIEVLFGEDQVKAEVEAEETFGLYCRAVDSLPAQCRRVFLLRKVYGLSGKAIAQRLGIAVSTVEKHLAKGVSACNAYLRKME